MSQLKKLFDNIYNISDYDEMYIDNKIIYTNEFTENMDQFEIIDANHPFISFLNGFTHNLFDIKIIHGWYHKETKQVKFYIENAGNYGSYVYVAWKKYCKMKNRNNIVNDYYMDMNKSIYDSNCGNLYVHLNEPYDIEDEKDFYKMFIKKLIDNM